MTDAQIAAVREQAQCHYCGSTLYADGRATCAGCGASKPTNPLGYVYGIAVWDAGLWNDMYRLPEFLSWDAGL